ncbi:hypothetical protein, partial [Acidaminococcus sp. HCP3S3_H5]|uniref:hypothetical protein n=1 Tax=Acidaminococcus sp. HCP3S3_H5 TaxID=3438733 RepID=UPI003F8DED57
MAEQKEVLILSFAVSLQALKTRSGVFLPIGHVLCHITILFKGGRKYGSTEEPHRSDPAAGN